MAVGDAAETPGWLKGDLLFARELLIRGTATIEEINECLKDVKEGESNLLQALIRRHTIKLTDVIQIKSDLKSWSEKEIEERHHKGPAISVSREGNRIALAQKSGFKKIGHYQILRELGRGGMGVVYAARDERLSRLVALKTALFSERGSSEAERFQREARLAASLNHPNIVAVHEVGEQDGIPFFTMELIDGLSLTEYVAKVKPGWNGVARIIRDVASALDYAHSKNVVHRDVKPANILLDMDGKPHLTDFGLARDIKGGRGPTLSGEVLGTPAYMSPEQANARRDDVGKTSDVYSLGATMYELLVGRPPFAETSMVKLLLAISEQEPIAPRKQNQGIPKDLEVICLKCLGKKPERRYTSGREVAADLDRYLKGRPIEARPASVLYKAGKWLWRNKAASASALALVLFSLLAWAWQEAARNDEAQRLLHEKEGLLAQVPGAAALEKKYPADALLTPEAEREIQDSLQAYMRAWRLVEEAARFAPSDPKIRRELYGIQKEIGALSLLGQNYLISQVFFARCKDMGNGKEAEKLLALVENRRREIVKRQLARVEEIMDEVASVPPQEGMVDEHVTEIVRMKGGHTAAKLLAYLESPHEWQRRVSIGALGKLGDRSANLGGKDVVEWLVQRLETLDLQKDAAEMEEIVWALGRLRDARADSAVDKIRWKAGENSIFWNNTRLPYSWLPLEGEGQKDPDNAFALCERGIMKHQKGDLDGAIADLDRAIRIDPRLAYAYNIRGNARQTKGDLNGAIADFDQAIDLDPALTEAYNNRGNVRYDKGDLEGAIADFDRAIHLDPRLAGAYANRGNVREDKGDLEGAIADFDQAIHLDPGCAMAYHNRGIVRRARGDLNGAIADCDQAIQLDPRYVEAYINRGIARQVKGDLDGAIADFNRAIQLDPRHVEAYINRGLARHAKGDLDNAIADCDQAIQLDPRSADAYFYRGNARYAKGDLDSAIADYDHAVQLDPSLVRAYNNRGNARDDRGDPDGAIADYNQSIRIDPSYSIAYYNRGNTRQVKGDLDGAIADYDRTIRLNPNLAQVYKVRAGAFQKKGIHQKAVADYRTYLKLCPDDPEAATIRAYIRGKKN